MSIVLKILLSALLVRGAALYAQGPVTYQFASKAQRTSTVQGLKNNIDSLIQHRANAQENDPKWRSAFWAMALMQYKPNGFEQEIPKMIGQLGALNPEFQRSFLEMLYGLYPKEFKKDILNVWGQLANAKNQAMALEYLARGGVRPKICPDAKIYGTPWHTAYEKQRHSRRQPLPEKSDFLDPAFLPNAYVLCSFQSPNRNRPGYLMVRTPDRQWLKDASGKPMRFVQLARSLSNLPSYLTNGNTPQGLFKITGTDISTDNWIGPVANLQIVMPFETNAFFEGDTLYHAFYARKLGAKLAQKSALWQTWEAGKLGRNEIIAHGTTIDPAFYKGNPFYPCTPSLGCLCSPELWSDDGTLLQSAQKDWMAIYLSLEQKPGWLIVAEVQDL